jgi:hypothetical protein
MTAALISKLDHEVWNFFIDMTYKASVNAVEDNSRNDL